MNQIELVLKSFEAAVEHCNKKYKERVEKLERAWSSVNEGLVPKQDCLGRWHSPCDGYSLAQDIDFHDFIDREKLYRKGEYLPTPIDFRTDENYSRAQKSSRMYEMHRSKDKIKVDANLAEQICTELANNSYIEFSHGNSWKVNGNEICYLYLKSHVENAFTFFVKSVKDAIENTEKQIYTGEAYEGRVRVTGKIVSIKNEEVFSYGYGAETETIKKFYIVLDNDSTCFGNAPASAYGLEVGDRVEFTATFTKSNNSGHHSYFKRPHKMIWIDRPESDDE